MTPRPPPPSLSPDPSPSSRTYSSRSSSTRSTQSTRSNPDLFTPRSTSPTPRCEMAQITLHQREVALSKATEEFSLEKAAFILEKRELQLQKDEWAAANDNVKQAWDAEVQRKRQETRDAWTKVAVFFLAIPVMTLGVTMLLVEAVGGWRILVWAVATAAGYRV
ncbi:hypothetical protein V491_09295 [Pseudogymnoascus sp. VKM F-3775]|nr:hypothetical protein V491_09295 [Pseudogymnoascus sp. VKM F-3775]